MMMGIKRLMAKIGEDEDDNSENDDGDNDADGKHGLR
jgi:hypothetical protein